MSVVDMALAQALPPGHTVRRTYHGTYRREITRRGVLWVGQTCNLRCHFCYFLDRIQDAHHPEHAFMTIKKAKLICRTLVDVYGNDSIDIQGGEPTLWHGIYELIRYCGQIGLAPTIITNGLALEKKERVRRFQEAGLKDFIVSVQGLGRVYDLVVGRNGAHARQMAALRNILEAGMPYRLNCVLSKAVLPQLPYIAEFAVRTGAEVVNFPAFTPFNDQRDGGHRSNHNVPTVSEIRPLLNQALDILASAGVEANVRYHPICVASERHRRSVYTFQQLPYDHHEFDYASWSWTELRAQRSRDAELSPPPEFGPRIKLGSLRGPLQRLARKSPKLGDRLAQIKAAGDRIWARAANALGRGATREHRYQENARLRAHEHLGYRYVEACRSCDVKEICDGFHGDYLDLFGRNEAEPIRVGYQVADPTHFIRQQEKKLHPDAVEW